MILEAVRYIRPNGQSTMCPFEIPDDMADTVALMGQLGIVVTVEDIPGGMVFPRDVVNVCLDHAEGDFRSELVHPHEVQETVTAVVREFDVHAFHHWRRAASRD